MYFRCCCSCPNMWDSRSREWKTRRKFYPSESFPHTIRDVGSNVIQLLNGWRRWTRNQIIDFKTWASNLLNLCAFSRSILRENVYYCWRISDLLTANSVTGLWWGRKKCWLFFSATEVRLNFRREKLKVPDFWKIQRATKEGTYAPPPLPPPWSKSGE